MRVMIFGTFDGLHPGHLHVLEEATRRAGENEDSRGLKTKTYNSQGLWVVVARDANVHRIKGRKALQSEHERVATIQQAFPSAHVILGNTTDFLQPIREIQPDLILLGYDQKLPPTITEDSLQTPIERLEPFHPELYKSSLRRTL